MRFASAASPLCLDPESGRHPRYQWLYLGIRRRILSGHLVPGSQLPSTRVLAQELGVSRSTLVVAYQQLAAEGLIAGRAGAGSYVVPRPAEPESRSDPRIAEPPVDPPTTLPQASRVRSLTSPLVSTGFLKPRAAAFRIGEPDLSMFPFRRWEELIRRQWRRRPIELMSEGIPEGYRPLRQVIAEYLGSARGIRVSPDALIIVRGAQQGIDLAARVLLGAGDAVVMEDPGYEYARASFEAVGANIVSGLIDQDGLDIDAARRAMPKPRVIYLTPSNQFPTNAVLSLPRRRAALEWAGTEGWIIEDDYDSEFSHQGVVLPALKGLDRSDRVVYVGSFSKALFPSLRLGYVVVPNNLRSAFLVARSHADRHAAMVDQAVAAEFIGEGHLARHVFQMRGVYAERCRRLRALLERDLGDVLEVGPVVAGTHLVAWLPPSWSDQAIAAAAQARGLELMPASRLSRAPVPRPGLILGFGATPMLELEHGVARLRELLTAVVRRIA